MARPLIKTIIAFFTYVSLALCLLSFLGFLHPAFDSLNVIRPITWLGAGLGSFFLGTYPQGVVRAIFIVTAFPFLIMFDQSQDFEDPALRIYQHNLLFTNTAPDLQMVVDRRQPDALTLQEIDKAHDTVFNLKGYPHQQICAFATVGEVGVVSRHPIVDSGCSSGNYRGFAWARISKDGQEVTIVSTHLHWPFPYSQAAQMKELIPQLEALPRPVVLAGDLNQVMWSHTARQISHAIDAPILDGLRFTLVRPPLFLPIDQAYGEGVYNVDRLDRYGSDHNALMVDFRDWPKHTQ